ncbi:MAG: hypothetical protein IPH57_05125 [Saprospiraceae bacterium]|nr:hypothetical protein [Saprospiraceae bacterium]
MTFAEKLRRSQDLYKLLEGFEAYTPPREEESLTGFKLFIDLLSQSNQNVISHQQDYRNWVNKRKETFLHGDKSIRQMIHSLRSVIISQYGANSKEKAQIDTIVNAIRYTKVSLTSQENQTPDQVKSYTLGNQSYGTYTKSFHDIVTFISGLDKYQPGNDEFKLENLNTILTNLNLLNDTVVQKYSDMQNSKRERKNLYVELKDRVKRIKSYVRSKYGTNSPEYGKIRSLPF